MQLSTGERREAIYRSGQNKQIPKSLNLQEILMFLVGVVGEGIKEDSQRL